MQLYAQRPGRALRQVAGDLAVLVTVTVAVRLGVRVHDVVSRLAAPGREVAEAGTGLARVGEAAGGRLADVPLVGGALRRPFELVAEGGRALLRAGEAQQSAAADLAVLLALLVAVPPVALLLALWLPRRLRWVREATAGTRLAATGEGEALLAWRAAATRPLVDVLRVEPDPWDALRRGQVARLAELERAALGLPRVPLVPGQVESLPTSKRSS